jgi:hypothetical protein
MNAVRSGNTAGRQADRRRNANAVRFLSITR